MIIEIKWFIGKTIYDLNKEVLLAALKYFNDDKIATAKSLGISDRVIYDKLKKYKAEDEAFFQKTEELRKRDAQINQEARGTFKIDPKTRAAIFDNPNLTPEEREKQEQEAAQAPNPAQASEAPITPLPGVKLDEGGMPIHVPEPEAKITPKSA